MNASGEVIVGFVESSGMALRGAVQTAVRLAQEHSLEQETLRALESRSSTGAKWLRAALTESVKDLEAAATLWERVVTEDGREVPEALLHRARASARGGDMPGAAALLRLALHGGPDYDFFIRAEALARKCKTGFGCRRKVRIALLGSSTTNFLGSVVEMLCLRDGLEPEIYEAPFGTYAQAILQADSELYRFGPEFIVLLLNWRDLGLPNQCEDGHTNEAISRVRGLWQIALERSSAHIIQTSFAPPVQDSYQALSSVMSSGRARTIRRINEALYAAAPARVSVVDAERIAAAHAGTWEDAVQWSSAKLYPAPEALPHLAEHVVSCIRAETGLSRKLLILDLDNTLWGGIVGEDGLDGIRLGPLSAAGERFQDFQRYLKGLRERGVLMAVVSKNNMEDAAEVFRRHQGSVLRLYDFVAFKANWLEKTANIRDLASELRLGLDSFVFLDDNPSERSAVRRELPEVLVPEISGEPSESVTVLERGLYFQSVRLTQEDTERSASYLSEAGREALRLSSGGVEEYLAGLRMETEHGPVDSGTAVRVTQLINKTNQFNLTTKRYSQEEVQRRMISPDCWFRWYRLRDRFADHGLIAVLLAEARGVQWDVDLWLMSCRVIGRGVEEIMFRDLVEGARQAGAERIMARYIRTPKNQLVEGLLPRLGFSCNGDAEEFVLDVASVAVPQCSFLQTSGPVGDASRIVQAS